MQQHRRRSGQGLRGTMLQRLQARQRVQRWCTMVGVIVTRVLLRHRQREMREAQQQHKLRRQQMLSEMQIRGTAATMRELRATLRSTEPRRARSRRSANGGRRSRTAFLSQNGYV